MESLILSCLRPDRFAHVPISVASQKLHEPFVYLFHSFGTAVNKAGDDLNERRSRFYFFIGVFRGEHSAEADQDILSVRSAINMADDIRRKLSYRIAGDAAMREQVKPLRLGLQLQNIAALREVTDHKAINKRIFFNDGQDLVNFLEREIVRNLQKIAPRFSSFANAARRLSSMRGSWKRHPSWAFGHEIFRVAYAKYFASARYVTT